MLPLDQKMAAISLLKMEGKGEELQLCGNSTIVLSAFLNDRHFQRAPLTTVPFTVNHTVTPDEK